jgi:CRP-like cAMP-binding protein
MLASFNPLIKKLQHVHPLSSEEIQILENACSRTVQFGAHRDIIREGDQPEECHVLLDGFVCRYKLLSDGNRQILSFHVPGDLYDTQNLLLPYTDHNIGSLTNCTVALMPHKAVIEMAEDFPRIGRALWKETLIDAAIFREWITNIGRRSAYARIAHLICETYVRLAAVGLAPDFTTAWPITQADIGDSQGLSTVHVNRTIQELRGAGLIKLEKKRLVIQDWEGLKSAAGFDPAYLRVRVAPVIVHGPNQALMPAPTAV